MVTIEVWSDFACPWCYLGASALRKLATARSVEIVWRAYEIRPLGTPISADYKARILAARERIAQVALERFDGLTFGGGPFGVNSRPAHVGIKVAEAHGKDHEYHAAVMEAYWQENADISDVGVLVAIAERVGLEGEAFRAGMEDEGYAGAVSADKEQAFQFGIGGVPSHLFNRRQLLQGAHPFDTLQQIVDSL